MGIAAAILSAASWAFGTVMFDRIGKVVPYAGITFLKGVMSISLMLFFVSFCGDLGSVTVHDAVVLTLSGIVGIAVGDTLFFKSLQELGAKVQVLFFMLGQVVTMVMSFILLNDVLSWQEYTGAVVLLCGVIIVTWGKEQSHPDRSRGIVTGLIAMLCFSASTVMIGYTESNIDILSATFYRMCAGTLIVSFFGLTTRRMISWLRPLKQVKTFGLFVLNVFVITIGGFVLSLYAIKTVNISMASVLSTVEPLFVLLFAYLINHEQASKRELIGAVVCISGLLIIVCHE